MLCITIGTDVLYKHIVTFNTCGKKLERTRNHRFVELYFSMLLLIDLLTGVFLHLYMSLESEHCRRGSSWYDWVNTLSNSRKSCRVVQSTSTLQKYGRTDSRTVT